MINLKEVKTDTVHYFKDEDGNMHGEYKYWDINGQLEIHCFFVNGEQHGESKWWWDNGQLREHSFYVNGERHGEYKWWYINGQLERHCFYVNDELHGEYKWWRDNGQLLQHCFFVNDEQTDIPIPTCDEDKFAICLEYGQMSFISTENADD